MAKATMNGYIQFSLVTIPIKLYKAQHSQDISFTKIHQVCGQQIKQPVFCPHCNYNPDPSEIVRAFDTGDKLVQISDEDLESITSNVPPKTIMIKKFVRASDVDPMYFDKGYFLGPDDKKNSSNRLALLHHTMVSKKVYAIARMLMRGNEHLAIIRPYGTALVLHTLYYADEIEVESVGNGIKFSAQENSLASQLVEKLVVSGFSMHNEKNARNEAIRKMLDEKISGKKTKKKDARVIATPIKDLVGELEASLSGG